MDMPLLIIKTKKNNIIIATKHDSKTAKHDIQLKLVLGYYWKNNLPFVEKFMELFETVIRRTLIQVFPFKKLYLKYNIESNDDLEESSVFKITLMDIIADDVELELVGNEITLEGIDNRGTMSKMTSFRRKVNETIEKEFVSQ
ncbi:hypothetical protein ALNOE001_03310 [Candidatus Methanobinarius endosymbioticus]|uniref:Uncharacterized protein n=1 Tax=Candidatus Methanobinarius endosymbioticus TaxID=2006182 RepID=A0A366MD96_9EURY|nr:hypothetical protein ALNOE001_03310 [Candidatus Methanobinarius endosymbioticus]